MLRKLCAALTGFAFMLTGCSSVTTEDYADKTPKLDIREYLNGPLEAWGIIYTMSGKQDMQFHVTMTGSWQGNNGTLEEHFTYSDGRKDERIWKFTFTDEHHFTGTAHDVVGMSEGSQHGNAVNMKYVLDAKRASGDTIRLTLDDWLYLMDDKTLINRTKMKKFGLTVGELVITFRKR